MKEYLEKNFTKATLMGFIGLALIAISGGYLTSIYIVSEEQNMYVSHQYEDKVGELTRLEKIKNDLSSKLDGEKANSKSLEGKVGNLYSAVDTLQKYAKTDKQLLEKYSKVYFLNENYIPESLVDIDQKYLLDKSKSVQFHSKAYPFLTMMLEQARSSGSELLIASAYRSYGTQTSLKSSYKTTFGTTAANSFSADQGYSEHQLGTTADFTDTSIGAKLDGFEKTREYQWLKDNAYKYGFELSYPANNKYYVFEPWHWRFVGVRLATALHYSNKNFYDMDQRDINGYLIEMFDSN